jgi:hypothetical protein
LEQQQDAEETTDLNQESAHVIEKVDLPNDVPSNDNGCADVATVSTE